MAGKRPLPEGFALFLIKAAGIGQEATAKNGPRTVVVSAQLPHNVTVHGMSDGFIVFDFSANPDYCGGDLLNEDRFADADYQKKLWIRNDIALKRSTFMNAFVATLWVGSQEAHHGLLTQPVVHIGNYIFAEKKPREWYLTGPASRPGNRWIPSDALSNASRHMNQVFSAYGDSAIEMLSLLQTAVYHYSTHEFSSCLVIGWSVVEALQNRMWTDLIAGADIKNGGHSKFNKDRRNQLNGRDFTASVVSQVLSISNMIDDVLLEKMNKARQARNAFAHSLTTVGHEIAFSPIHIATELISKKTGISFRMGGGFSWHG